MGYVTDKVQVQSEMQAEAEGRKGREVVLAGNE